MMNAENEAQKKKGANWLKLKVAGKKWENLIVVL